jgi:transcriptional regulator with XRE-family HTH domain
MKSNIAAIRKAQGLQQIFVAEQIKVSPQLLSAWENNRRYPRTDQLFALAKALNCTTDELYDYKNI